MNWATQEETVACCQEEGFLQKGDVVSTITGEYSTMTYCFEHKGKSCAYRGNALYLCGRKRSLHVCS